MTGESGSKEQKTEQISRREVGNDHEDAAVGHGSSEGSVSMGSDSQDENAPESFALSKEEASKFQEAIKSYYDRCVSKEVSCNSIAMKVSKHIDGVEQHRKAMEAEHRRKQNTCDKTLTFCEKESQSVRYGGEKVKKKRDEIQCIYDKILFAAANAEDIIRCSITALSTTTEVLKANNEMVHRPRQRIGEFHVPIKLKDDLAAVATNISLHVLCRSKRSIIKNNDELAVIARKVALLDAHVEEDVDLKDVQSEESEDEEAERVEQERSMARLKKSDTSVRQTGKKRKTSKPQDTGTNRAGGGGRSEVIDREEVAIADEAERGSHGQQSNEDEEENDDVSYRPVPRRNSGGRALKGKQFISPAMRKDTTRAKPVPKGSTATPTAGNSKQRSGASKEQRNKT